MFWRRMSASQHAQALAYHGVRADGSLCKPGPALGTNPLGRVGLALLMAQVMLVASGGAVIYEEVSARHRCEPLPAAVSAALTSELGQPAPGGAASAAPVGSVLVAARLVRTQLAEVSYVAGYVRSPDGRVLGPAVWRAIEPGGVFPTTTVDITAFDPVAPSLTPRTGYGTMTPQDSRIGAARDCARDARN
jgi:hypothetical protein